MNVKQLIKRTEQGIIEKYIKLGEIQLEEDSGKGLYRSQILIPNVKSKAEVRIRESITEYFKDLGIGVGSTIYYTEDEKKLNLYWEVKDEELKMEDFTNTPNK